MTRKKKAKGKGKDSCNHSDCLPLEVVLCEKKINSSYLSYCYWVFYYMQSNPASTDTLDDPFFIPQPE